MIRVDRQKEHWRKKHEGKMILGRPRTRSLDEAECDLEISVMHNRKWAGVFEHLVEGLYGSKASPLLQRYCYVKFDKSRNLAWINWQFYEVELVMRIHSKRILPTTNNTAACDETSFRLGVTHITVKPNKIIKFHRDLLLLLMALQPILGPSRCLDFFPSVSI